MDEHLIVEVQKHAIIYNRQKYFLTNNPGPEMYENKEDAWSAIAIKLGTDINTCKKRWKYLRERYVQQRKQGDTPTYEHLARPYLEKMKFLDQHIQPRKSYRNVSNFLPSPKASFGDLMDSSRSDGSINNIVYNNYQDKHSTFKLESDMTFQHFSPMDHHHPQSGYKPLPHLQPNSEPINFHQQNSLNTHPPPLTQSTNSQHHHEEEHRENNETCQIPSSSSSIKSPLSSSPPNNTANVDVKENPPKRPRVDNNITNVDSSDDESQDNNNHQRQTNGRVPAAYSNDFLYSIYQQFPQHRQQVRSSEHLLGELVTSELLKMNRERRKNVQKRILEILFFED